VIVSAFATRGLSADVMRLVLSQHEFVTSEVVLEEVERVLSRKLRVPRAIVDDVLSLLREHPVQLEPEEIPDTDVRDPDDARVLASALAARADVFVTGDRDFLDLKDEIEGIEILDPRGFWEMHRR
jgi:putative PIN family toxin of toxin-antitoxin system